MTPDPTKPDHFLAALARVCAVSALVALFCWISIRYTREPGGTSILWIASGFLVGILLTSPHRRWPGYIAGAVAANVIVRIVAGDPWPMGLGLALASLVEALTVAIALNHWIGDVTDLSRIGRIARVAFGSTFIACVAAALVAAPVLAAYGKFPAMLGTELWFTSHTLGMVIFATLTVVLRAQGLRLFGRSGRRLEFVLTILLVGAVCLVVFSQSRYPMLFLVYPPLLLCAFRQRIAGVILGTLVVAASAIVATLTRHGPFEMIAGGSPHERILLTQVFIACTCLMIFPVLTVLTERRFFARKLRQSELRLRAIADNVPVIVAHVDLNGCYTFVNAHMGALLGAPPQSLIGKTVKEIAGEVYDKVLPHAQAALRGEFVTWELQRDLHGRNYCLHMTYVPDRDARGGISGYYVLSYDITRMKQVEHELDHMAHHDSLTGLANRRQFDDAFARAIARQIVDKEPLALIFLDVDRFKQINDTLGHTVGDRVLQEFAKRLRETLHGSDFLARLGGDEFVVLIEDAEQPEQLDSVGRRLCTAMRRSFAIEGRDVKVTTSIGIGFWSRPSCTIEALFDLADQALYEAKAAGRDTWRIAVADVAITPG